jgi:hypothetical protein
VTSRRFAAPPLGTWSTVTAGYDADPETVIRLLNASLARGDHVLMACTRRLITSYNSSGRDQLTKDAGHELSPRDAALRGRRHEARILGENAYRMTRLWSLHGLQPLLDLRRCQFNVETALRDIDDDRVAVF